MNTETQQGSAYSVINYNPTTKEQAESFANKLTEEVLQGEVNPLELHVKLTAMQKAIDAVKKNIASYTLTEAQKYNSKTFDFNSSKIEIQELGAKYNYDNCNDAVLVRLNAELEKIKSAVEQRQAFLKVCKPGQPVIDEETGESYEVFPPAKTSTTGVKVTLK
jgi:hypothetical protein